MLKRYAFKLAKNAFGQDLTPTRASWYTECDGVVFVRLFEINGCLVLNTKKDIERLAGMCELALRRRNDASARSKR